MYSAEDGEFMEKAFEMAEEALACDEVPVGCVFVHNGVVIGSGRNEVNKTKDPTRHAEMVAIARMEQTMADVKQILRESTLYVTLEPCIMCASGLFQLGVKRIVYGACNERFGGVESVGSAEKYKMTEVDCEIVSSVAKERSIALLKAFYDKENPFAPLDKRKTKKRPTEAGCDGNSLSETSI